MGSSTSPSSTALYSVDCFISQLGFVSTPIFYLKNLAVVLNPIINLLLFLILKAF